LTTMCVYNVALSSYNWYKLVTPVVHFLVEGLIEIVSKLCVSSWN